MKSTQKLFENSKFEKGGLFLKHPVVIKIINMLVNYSYDRTNMHSLYISPTMVLVSLPSTR